MTDIMSQSELKWSISSKSESMDQPPAKRPLSPHDENGRASYKSQKSISDVLGPEMDNVHLVTDGEDGPNHGDMGRLNPELVSEAATLLDTGLDALDDGTGVDEVDAGGDECRVKKPIQIFEPSGPEEASQRGESPSRRIEEEDIFSCSTAATEEFMPDRIIAKTAHKVKQVAKMIGQTVVEGLKMGARELKHVVQKFHLPQSSLEKHPDNNIHVPHPDKLIGGMVGLGMHIQKHAEGHVVGSVIPDGLAAKSKLQENDVIVSVNGVDVKSWGFEELQQFFGSLEEVYLKIVVEREGENEDGEPVCHKVTICLTLSLEGDQVMVDIDVQVHISQWEWSGETKPAYIFQNPSGQSIRYLMLKNNRFCMSTGNDLKPCLFKLYSYSPVKNQPKAIINVTNGLPLDHQESSKIGVVNDALTHKLFILNDSRIFFTMRQLNTYQFTFRLASHKDYYLTSDAKGNLTTQYFSSIDDVEPSGLFNIVSSDKISPSDMQKYNPTGK